MNFLITGGAGFIGSRLATHLLATHKGSQVTVLDDFSRGTIDAIRGCYNERNFSCMRGSVLNPKDVDACVSRADVVFHLAAQIHVEESIFDPVASFDTNSRGTLNVLEACRWHRTGLLVYASSTEVYGNARTELIREDHPFNPQSPYAAGKAAADRLCAAYFHTYKMPVVVLRQFNTYGPGQRDKGYAAVIPQFASRLLAGRPPIIYGDGEQSRDFHYIDDLMRVYDLVLEHQSKLHGLALNFGTGINTTINDLATSMLAVAAEVWERPDLLKLAPTHAAPRPGEVFRFGADIGLAHNLLGFEPTVAMREGLTRYLRWYRLHSTGE